MTSEASTQSPKSQKQSDHASVWVRRFASQVPSQGHVLDLACGGGRHSRLFLELGHPVLAVDRDLSRISEPEIQADFETQEIDLEDGGPFPFAPRSFDGIVVTNYLFRPILPGILQAVCDGGVLIYETFALGNERFGRPSNPDFLLAPGELLDTVAGELRVLAYEDLIVDEPKPAAVQRICARREN